MLFDSSVPKPLRLTYRYDSGAALLAGMFSGLTAPFVLVIARRLGASPLAISAMVAVPFLGHFMTLHWATLMEGRGKKAFAIAAWTVGRSAFLMAFFVHSVPLFAAMVIVSGLLEPLAGTAYAAMLGEMYPDRLRAGAMSRVKIEGMLVTIVATLAAGQAMGALDDYRFIFPVAAVLGLAGVVVFSRIQSADGRQLSPQGTLYTINILGRDRGFRSFSTAFVLAGSGHLVAKTLYPLLLVDVLHATNFQVGALAAAAQVVQLGAYFFWGRWIDERTPAEALVRGFLLLAGAPLVYMAACAPWLTIDPTAWLVLPASVLLGAGAGATELASVNCLLQFASDGRAGRYISVHKGLVGIRGAVAPFVAVQLMHMAGWGAAFLTAFGVTMVGVALMSRVSRALLARQRAKSLSQYSHTPSQDPPVAME
jgi:hypothetical protein